MWPFITWKRARRWLMFSAGLTVMLLLGCYLGVAQAGQQELYEQLQEVPPTEVALLLGMAHTVMGRPNAYYVYRIQAALQLWQAHKFQRVIVSGSLRLKGAVLYDEIGAMRRDLMAGGIPASAIFEDPDAHRTLLSVEQAYSRFQLTRYVLISQKFHCERALFLARKLGQNPLCYVAQDVPLQPMVMVRELLSRAIAVWEMRGLSAHPNQAPRPHAG